MLKELITQDVIRCNAHAANWEEAVRIAGALLVDAHKCEASYVDAMVETVHKFGPYIVLEEGIAMPHAQSRDNVAETGISVVTLQEPVCFGHDEYDPVSVLIGFCSPSSNGHMGCLSELAQIFDDEEIISKLSACNDAREVKELLQAAI